MSSFLLPAVGAKKGAQLLQGEAWKIAKPQVCRLLERETTATKELENLATQLNEAYQHTAQNFSSNAAVRIELVDGKETLVLKGLDKIEEPSSLKLLRRQMEDLLPRVDLPEVLLEVQAKTGFALEFTHVSEAFARVQDLPTSICAVLLAEACNIGLEPLVRADVPALTKDRLSWVKQNYLRQETIVKANACLVDAQANIPLAQSWGGGEVASESWIALPLFQFVQLILALILNILVWDVGLLTIILPLTSLRAFIVS